MRMVPAYGTQTKDPNASGPAGVDGLTLVLDDESQRQVGPGST